MPNNNLLLHAIKMNAIFSGLSALVLMLAGPWVAAQLGLAGATPVYVTAGLLAVFALQLGNIVRTGVIRPWEITSIIGGDISWVAASAVLVVLFYPALTITGLILVDFVALAVLYLAIQQIRGLRALRADASA